MTRLRQAVALTGLTACDVLRQPVYLLLTLLAVALTALLPFLILHSFGEDGKLVRDSAFALQAVLGVFVAGYAAATALSSELERGTASAVLSKPVERNLFYVTKFTGVVVVVSLYSLCCGLATLLVERVAPKFVRNDGLMGYVSDHQTGAILLAVIVAAALIGAAVNYRLRRPFGSTVMAALLAGLMGCLLVAGCFDRLGEWSPFALRVDWRLVPVSYLVAVALIVMAALAMLVASVMGTVPTLTICSTMFVLGLMSDYLFGRHATTSLWARVLYTVVPNWQHFWVCDRLNAGGVIGGAYVGVATLYGAVYAAALVCLGMVIFRQRDI